MTQLYSMRHSQSGAALIAVLLFVVLIAIAGAIAVRQSGMDLRVATSDQADALMLNASDGVLAHIETVADDPANPRYKALMSQTKGVLGYFIPLGGSLADPNEKVDWQVRFCYSATAANLFELSNSRVLQLGGGVMPNANLGRCEANKATSYVSARKTWRTQVVTRGLTGQTAYTNNFNAVPTGQQAGVGTTVPSPRIAMHSVSTLPALSNASNADISTCMDKAVGDVSDTAYGSTYGDQNMTACLQANGIPATALVEEGVIAFERQGCDAQQVVDSAGTTC